MLLLEPLRPLVKQIGVSDSEGYNLLPVADQPSFSKLMSQWGLSKSLQRIKFGGVVGKQTLLGVVGASALVSIAWRVDPKEALIVGAMATIVLVTVAILNFCYAHKHPAEAMLEGGEMLVFQHQVLAAKSVQLPQDSPIIPNPGGSPPQLDPPGDAG